MAQLNEKEMELAALICEGCTTPAELTAKLRYRQDFFAKSFSAW